MYLACLKNAIKSYVVMQVLLKAQNLNQQMQRKATHLYDCLPVLAIY